MSSPEAIDDEEYRRLQDATFEITQTLDRAVLTLSAGAVALSLTFLENIIEHRQPLLTWVYLGGTWISFGLAIMLTLFALSARARATDRLTFLHLALSPRARAEPGFATAGIKALDKFTKYTDWTKRFSSGALVAFVLGLIFMCFLGVNSALNQEKGLDPKPSVTTSGQSPTD